ncbi:HU family DNA-binding protein [Roseovarius ramblicola]|uniref:HU family DNA-binding protein n=1 Tax=Roseovarius ramblicola TaxID=2022336 RepID=A0ABV5HYV5_9RHOB
MASKASSRGSASDAAPAPRKRAATPARPAAPAPRPVVVEQSTPEPTQPDLKRQELLAQVVARSEVKKKYAKPALEAALAVIGEALAEGRELNLAPMGKVKINRTKQMANGRVIVARIRQNAPRDAGGDTADDKAAKEGVADPAEGR